MFEGAPPEVAKAFGADRAAMSGGMTRLRPGDATAAYKSYLRRLANMLEGQDFLLFGPAPCVADFAAYHPLWFSRVRVPVMAGILDATPEVLNWMDRMADIGHGQMDKMTSAEAIAICAAAPGPAPSQDHSFQDEHNLELGSRVTVAAENFGRLDRGRTACCDAHALHAAPCRPTRRHRARALPAHWLRAQGGAAHRHRHGMKALP